MRKKKTQRKILVKNLDDTCSKIVRSKGYCEWCGRKKSLQASHIMRRTHFNTRWDLDNFFCLCVRCHLYRWHKEPVEAMKWAESMIGEDKITELIHLSNQAKKFEIYELEELLEERKNQLERLQNEGINKPTKGSK